MLIVLEFVDGCRLLAVTYSIMHVCKNLIHIFKFKANSKTKYGLTESGYFHRIITEYDLLIN